MEAILGRTSTVSVLATSREGLRVSAEQVWTVPSLGVGDGVDSPAVTLFVRRAQAANSSFALYDDADVVAVREICERLDGIALSIELAAARMVSMSPQDVRDRLGERFRLLAGGRRGLERHQTLRHAVAWSYDLLNDEERAVLCRCSVFASGFDLAAAAHLNEGFDEYAVLDVLDSLVRKSLVTVNQAGGHARYGMLETIRQYAEDQLAATGGIEQVRDRHARYFAEQAVAHWVLWDGPHQRDSLDWFDEKFANLRAGFRWATDRGDLACAAAIAAHSAMLGGASLGRYKPVEWVEEILGAANRADLAQLPRLYVAASFCGYNGRPDQAASYAQTAAALEADGRYDPFEAGWSGILEASAHGYAGRIDRFLEIHTGMAAMGGFAHVAGLCGLSSMSPNAGHSEQGRAIAEVAVTTAAAYGNPALIAWAAWGFGRAFEHADPDRALSALREGLLYAQQHRADYFEALIARDVARVAAMHGEIDQGLGAFDASIDSFHRAGNVRFLAFTLADLAVIFDRIELHDNAATLYGASKRHGSGYRSHRLQSALEHLNAVLGNSVYAQRVAIGAAMELSDAVAYAHHHIQTARTKFTGPS